MAMISRPRRTREFTGPTPGSVAIRARPPNSRPSDFFILEQRKLEDAYQKQEKLEKYVAHCDRKNNWELKTNRMITLNKIRQRVDGLKKDHEYNVEDRRDKLRALLAEEEEIYFAEMDAKEETTIERQAKMRERAKFLKDRREEERLQFVQEKLDQQFRDQCEELRSTQTKRQQDQVCAERLEQLRIKKELDIEKKAEDAMYAKLWEQDMLTKAAREEREAKAQHERDREVLEVLRKQMAALEAQKEEAKMLREEEAQLLREQDALRKLEEAKALEEKRRRQKETREMLDLNMKMKMKKKAKEEQEQLSFDLKMLEKLLQESRNEAMEMAQRKKELRVEDRRYRDYLEHLHDLEKKDEDDLQKLIQDEVEKTWKKRLAQWQRERDARKKLFEDVLAIRAGQIRSRLLNNERQQIESQREKEEIQGIIALNKHLEEERLAKILGENLQYQSDLVSQMEYNNRIKLGSHGEQEREYLAGLKAEQEYQEKLKDALDHPYVGKMHPMRRYLMSQERQ